VNAIEYLFGLEFHGHKLGLQNIVTITDAMGCPQDAYPSIHVAGTNGKGSVCAMTAAALQAAGYRTGCYTSPHLVDLEERFAVDGVPQPRDEVEDVVEYVRSMVDSLLADGRLPALPTFFEVATATAFELFRRAGVDVAVLEVGLGGRLDATNVATPRVGVITNISLEHQQYLGDTVTAIAAEKAGIIKPGMTVVSGIDDPEAAAVVAEACRLRGAPLVEAAAGVAVDATSVAGRIRAAIRTPDREYPACVLALRGRHQIANAVLAVRALEAVQRGGLPVPASAVAAGLERARWPGRLEYVRADRGDLLLDCAHNPAGARTLAAYLAEVHPGGLPLVIGAVGDKDHAGLLAPLLPHATRVIVTEPPTPRAMRAADLAAIATRVQAERPGAARAAEIVVEADLGRAIDDACDAGPVACLTGSIFLVGAALARIARR
jgi:dihydrofolate synthase/folylpolyglutamate synthase